MIELYRYSVKYRNTDKVRRGFVIGFGLTDASIKASLKGSKRMLEKYGRADYNVRMLLKIV